MRHLFKFLLIIGLVGFATSLALADTGGVATDPYAMYYPAIAALIGAIGALVRGFSPQTGFWHQWYGHALLALIGCLLGSALPVFEAGSVTKTALLSAFVGGVSTFLGAFKTKGKPADGQVQMILPLALGAMFLSGCEGLDDSNLLAVGVILGGLGLAFILSRVLSTPRLYRTKVLIPFVFLGCLSISGCQTTGGQALGKCELGSLPATLESVIAEVIAVAMNPASVVTDLEGLGGKIGPAQLACAVQAVEAWLSGSSPATSSRLMAGVGESQRQHGLELLHTYLNAHPATACSTRIAL